MMYDTGGKMENTYSDQLISDLHKEAYGYRPRLYFWESWAAMTPDEKQAEWDRLLDLMAERDQEDQERRSRAIYAAELELAGIMYSVPGSTRDDALRILAETHGCYSYVYGTGYVDLGELCYTLGLPYGYFETPKS